MKIEHLRYFASFAGAESINQAAKELFISKTEIIRYFKKAYNNIITVKGFFIYGKETPSYL